MLQRSLLTSKLSKLIFLNVNADAVNKIFGTSFTENIYLPLIAEDIIEGVKENRSFDEIPVKDFLEGMYLVVGCDENFKYAVLYKTILASSKWCSKTVKSSIAELIKRKQYLDGYMLLRGLYTLESTEEIYEKMLWCLYNEYGRDKGISEELKNIAQLGKELNNASAYFYESILNNEEGKYVDARNALNIYFSLGGQRDNEIDEYFFKVKVLADLENGKESMSSNPKYALELLLPLLDEMEEDANLYYYIAVAYRHLGIYQKAIYYLNEAMRVDSTIVDLFNEMGLNFACLGDYDRAISYFKKAFEATRSIEICTNIIMCYINKGDMNEANVHLELAKKINDQDEIVKDIEKVLRGYNKKNGD